MAGQFTSREGDLELIFIDDYTLIDQFAKTGSLWSWGLGTSGQLGDNTIASKSSPVQTVSSGTNWKSVPVSFNTSMNTAIKTDGTLWTWGDNSKGQLGNNTNTGKSSPIQTVAAGTNWRIVSCGLNNVSAIKTDGTLWTWGLNAQGQMGDNTIVAKSSPIQTVAGGTNWKVVTNGSYHTAAIKTDGTLWTWGQGNGLGDNTTVNKSSPVQTISGGTNWKMVAGGQGGSGAGFNVAVKTDGTLWTWGVNTRGTLGDNTATNRSSPVQTVAGGTNWKMVAAGRYNGAGIKSDGTLWIWGNNVNGELGNGTNSLTYTSSPVQTVSGGTNWKQVSVSFAACAGVKTDGTLWTWGLGNFGTLGDNTAVSKSSPVQTAAGGTNWKMVASGRYAGAGIYFYDADNLYPK